MPAISPFPLLDLPFVALHEVLKETFPIELIQFSSVSKKTQAIVKSFLKRNSTNINYKLCVRLVYSHDALELDLWHGDNEKLKIRFNTIDKFDLHKQPMISMMYDNVNVLVNDNYDCNLFTVLCEDVKTTSKNMLQYLCKLFNPIISVKCYGNQSLTSEVLDVLKDENAKLDELSFSALGAIGHFYKKLLQLPIRKLHLSPFPLSFEYESFTEPMKFKELEIADARWVTNLEDFLHCKRVVLGLADLNNQNINRFLRKWKECDCQLVYLRVHMIGIEPNLREIVEGVPVEPLDKAFTGSRFQDFKNGECFRFKQSNGGKGIIYQDGRYIILQTESCGRS